MREKPRWDGVERLRPLVKNRFGEWKAFQRAVAEKGVKGSSYPSVHGYLEGTAVPGIEFLQAAADVLGVRFAWLAIGEGEPTEELQAVAQYKALVERPNLTDHDVEDAFAFLSADDKIAYRRLQPAVVRFSQKLQDAGGAGTEWMEREGRRVLLQALVRYLIGEEELFRRVTLQDPDAAEESVAARIGHDHLFLRASSSPGWQVMWQDAVMQLFAMRVRGLGERTEEFWDQHSPAAAPRVDYSI